MIKKFLMLLLIVVVVLLLGKNFLIKYGAAAFVKVKSGMTLNMDYFKLRLLSSKVDIKGLNLYNSKQFENSRMISIPEIIVNLSVPKLFRNELYLKELRFNMEEFTVVKNKDGKINFQDFAAFKGEGKKEKAPKKEKGKKEKAGFYIESFDLNIGKVVFKNYSGGGEPSVQEFEVNISKSYKDIDNVTSLASLIVVEALARTTIAKLASLDLSDMKTFSADAMRGGVEMTRKGAAATRKAAVKTAETTEKAAAKTAEATQKAASKTAEATEKAAEKIEAGAEKSLEKVKDLLPFGN